MSWIKINKEKPKPLTEILLKGLSYFKEPLIIIGHYNEKENRFITSPKGWGAEFTDWQPLPKY